MKTRIITAILLSSSFLNALCITHQTHFPVDGDSFCEWDMEDMANTRLRLDYVGNRVYRNGTLERLGFENGYIDGDGTYCYCLRDWQGNNRVVLAGNDSIIESDNYYPYGQHFTEGAQAAYSAQRWKFGDKEFDAEKGLNWHDFGARFLMPQFGLFTTQDPLRHRNWHLSPYLYCAANPIRFIDPTGMFIAEGSLREWNLLREDIIKQRDRLQLQIEKINAQAVKKSWSSKKLDSKLGDRFERIESLSSSLNTMDKLENSSQGYSLNRIFSSVGELTYDMTTGLIEIKYFDAPNFVHEMTHAGQFESGELGLVMGGGTILQDVYDEVAAYKAQYAFSPYSVSGLVHGQYLKTIHDITDHWVKSIEVNGKSIYNSNSENNTGQFPININSPLDHFRKAYTDTYFPQDFKITSDPKYIFKR